MSSQPASSTFSASSDAAAIDAAGKALPAWLVSIVLHLVLLVVLGLFVRSSPRGLTQEPDRQGSIVLARATTDEPTRYLDESDAAEAEQQSSTNATAALPDHSETAPPDTTVKLPDAVGAALPPTHEGLFQQPQLRDGGRPRLDAGPGAADILAEEAARRKPNLNTGPAAQLSVFGSAPASGHSFVFVIDRSKSMGGEGLGVLSQAERELAAAVAALQPNHRFQVVAYHHQRTLIDDGRFLAATEDNKQKLADFLGNLAAFGGTNHDSALRAALRLEPDVVFLLTDGGDPYLTDGQHVQIRRLAGRTTIHCLQFGFGPLQSDGFMQRLAAEHAGSFRYVDMAGR